MSAGGCVRCGTVSGADASFCMACGAPLGGSCAACGAAVPADARFCMACGADIHAAGAPLAVAPEPVEERRTVTVLFADIVGYTTIAERLDHESVKRLTDRCMERLAAEVARFGGHVDQYIGDNLMAVFGAPHAHENDAERAVRAACAMHEAMAELNNSMAGDYDIELRLRVGVNTGEVLAGSVGGEYTVVGDAVNIASRLQGAAEQSRTLVGERTRRATAASVSYRPVGSLALKGKVQPVSAWEVIAIEEPGACATGAVRAPLIGRRSELEHLYSIYDKAATQGDAQVVTLVGEAGVGKTRLVQELDRRLAERRPAPLLLRGRALGFGSESGFGPLAQMLREEVGAGQAGESEPARKRLLDALSPTDGSEPELDGEDARERFFAGVVAFVRTLAGDRPLVLVWEDAQWADEGTLELIDHLAESLDAPVLQVCVGREDLLTRRPRWATNRRRRTCVFLEPLEPDDARGLIDALLPGTASEQQRELLARRTGGNPLFAEALVDALGEGAGAALPETIQGLLAARLDSLDPFERQLLGHASVVGLRFRLDALQSLSVGADLHAALGSLQERNLIVASGPAGPDREYAFAHMLIREAAYEMLPKSVRARKHMQVADALARAAGAPGEPSAFALAVHYERGATLAAEVHLPPAELAGMRRAALEHGIAAGDAAAALFSNQEALERYRAASAFAEPEDPLVYEIAERSGDVELRLGRVDPAIDAWGLCLSWHRSREDAERAAEMHRKIAAALVHKGERDAAVKHLQRGINMVRNEPASPALARLFGEAATLYIQLGANMLAAYAAERALAIAEQLDDPRAASRAHMIYGGVYARIGDAAKARGSLARAVELVRDVDLFETVVALLAAGRHLDRFEGDTDGARQHFTEGLALARRTGDVPVQIELHAELGAVALRRAEWGTAGEEADAAAALAEAHGLAGKLCLAEVLRGRLHWRRGELDRAAILFESARDGAAQLGYSEVGVEALLGLGATFCDAGRLEAAAAAFGEAVTACERAGLGPQAAEAGSGLALVALRAGRAGTPALAAARTRSIAVRGPGPVAGAAALEASGLLHEDPAQGAAELDRARQRWEDLGRPLDAARCIAGIAELWQGSDEERRRGAARMAAARFEELQVGHLAERWRQLARGSAGAVS